MVSNTDLALRLAIVFPLLGFRSPYSSSSTTAFINDSVSPTEMLKLLSRLLESLQVTNSRISGWSIRRMPILAPLLVPPCFTASVALSNTVMNDMGPEDIPLVEPTTSPLGLSLEKLKPVPPPDLWIIAANLTASNIDSMESPTGRTKHAESWPSLLPAFISVGLFGRNAKDVIIS